MVPAYYQLITSYTAQDTVVVLCWCFAALTFLGWQIITRFGFRWLEAIYLTQMLAVWVGLQLFFLPTGGL